MTATQARSTNRGDRVTDRLPPLPLCPLTELPRLLCGCGTEGCDHFSMTESELAFMRGDNLPPEEPRRGLQLKNLPEYQSRPWSEPRDVKIVDSPNLCRVPHCTKPAGDAFVCGGCLDDADVALADVPGLLEDLTVLVTKQARFGGSGSSNDSRPLPFNPAAGDMISVLSNSVTTAVRMLCEHRGIPQPALDAVRASQWLLGHLPSVALDVAGPDMVADIVRETRRARKMIDRPEESVYIGLCSHCATPMHAKPDRPEHRCLTCGTEYVVAERREEIKARVMESLLSVTEIVEISEAIFGKRLSRKNLDNWVGGKRLMRAGSKPNPKNPERDTALYRAGDVLALVEERKAS